MIWLEENRCRCNCTLQPISTSCCPLRLGESSALTTRLISNNKQQYQQDTTANMNRDFTGNHLNNSSFHCTTTTTTSAAANPNSWSRHRQRFCRPQTRTKQLEGNTCGGNSSRKLVKSHRENLKFNFNSEKHFQFLIAIIACLNLLLLVSSTVSATNIDFAIQKHKDTRWNQTNKFNEDSPSPPVVIDPSSLNEGRLMANSGPYKPIDRRVGAGSNISLECMARGAGPLTFVWFQDERNITTTQQQQLQQQRSNGGEQQPSSTKLLEDRRYEIAQEQNQIELVQPGGGVQKVNVTTSILYLFNLKLTDTSFFFCWVENAAGYTMANFSLTVDESPPVQLNGQQLTTTATATMTGAATSSVGGFLKLINLVDGSGQSANHLGIATFIFIIALVTGIILLLVFKQHHNSLGLRSSGSGGNGKNKKGQLSANDIKHPHHQQLGGKGPDSSKLANGKSSLSNHHLAQTELDLADSDEEGPESDDMGSSSDPGSHGSFKRCKSSQLMSASDLDGFIEHMRSGIINMDYHSMSPVIQFNKTNNAGTSLNNKQQQQPQQQLVANSTNSKQPYLLQQPMHHFPSASNASSVPSSVHYPLPYMIGQQQSNYHNGSISMATTTSDLSPSSGSSAATTNNQFLMHHLHNGQAAGNNAASVSYTSDYQSSGYGANEQEIGQMLPMYYEQQQQHLQPDLYQAKLMQQHLAHPVILDQTLLSQMRVHPDHRMAPQLPQQQQQPNNNRLSQQLNLRASNHQLQASLDSERFHIL